MTIDPGGTSQPGIAAQFSATASLGALAFPVYDHLNHLIGGVGPTGGWKTFGDRTQAASGLAGPFMALDGTTNPPSILLPSTTYGAGGRIWAWAGTPAAGWVSGTTHVNDLWWNVATAVWYICTVSGAGSAAGTWVARSSSIYKQTQNVTPSATLNVQGTPVTFSPESGFNSLQITGLPGVYGAASGVSGETLTLNVTAYYSDGTNSGAQVLTFTSNANVGFGTATFLGLFKDGVTITSITASVASSKNSSTASVAVYVLGTNGL